MHGDGPYCYLNNPGFEPCRSFSTSRQRAKSTAATERIGHGGATHQTANLCGKLNFASLPRPQGRAGARLFQQPDLENHWEPMRNRARSSVIEFVAQATQPAVLCYATAKLLRDEAESMVPNIGPEQVRKLAGWGLTQNDIASFVGWSQSLISLGF